MSKPYVLVGEPLGGGAYKDCYDIVQAPDYVALVQAGGSAQNAFGGCKYLARELAGLKKLAKLGLPVLEGKIRRVILKGEPGEPAHHRKVWAIVAPKYEYWWYDGGAFPKKLKRGHFKELLRIYRTLEKNKVIVNDLQFLARGTDDVVIADPLSIGHQYDSGFYRDDIRRITKRIKNLVRKKKNGKGKAPKNR